jgi:hypothetical protein
MLQFLTIWYFRCVFGMTMIPDSGRGSSCFGIMGAKAVDVDLEYAGVA